MLDGIDVLCTDSSEKYMINVTKEKPDGKADLDCAWPFPQSWQ